MCRVAVIVYQQVRRGSGRTGLLPNVNLDIHGKFLFPKPGMRELRLCRKCNPLPLRTIEQNSECILSATPPARQYSKYVDKMAFFRIFFLCECLFCPLFSTFGPQLATAIKIPILESFSPHPLVWLRACCTYLWERA